MLSKSKKEKLLVALKKYHKQYLSSKISELDESGTRLMVNSILTEVLGFAPIEEVKTEYMIRGTYADYVVQMNGIRHFLVEVKALSFELSDKHLRQAINYGANEGIEWALLTNGKKFDLYKIHFEKPISSTRVFSLDLCDVDAHKNTADAFQYLHKECVVNNGLDALWNKHLALSPLNVAGLLYGDTVKNFIQKNLRAKFKIKLSEDDIESAINRLISEQFLLSDIKPIRIKRTRKPKLQKTEANTITLKAEISPDMDNKELPVTHAEV